MIAARASGGAPMPGRHARPTGRHLVAALALAWRADGLALTVATGRDAWYRLGHSGRGAGTRDRGRRGDTAVAAGRAFPPLAAALNDLR